MKRLSRSSGKVFAEMKETLKRQIELGELAPGEAIMAERKLARLFSISRESVRRGLRELIEEGYLRVLPAKGVFVNHRGAKHPRLAGTSTLGYIFWGTTEAIYRAPFFEGLVRGVEQEVQEQGLHLMVASEPGDEAKRLPRMIAEKKVDGVLLEGAPLEVYRYLEQHVPVVVISNYIRTKNSSDEISGDMVSADNLRAIMNLVSYLYHLGHRKIGFATPPVDHSSFYERMEGYHLALHKHDLPFRQEYVVFTQQVPRYSDFLPVLKRVDRPTVIVCGNDVTALALLDAAHRVNLPVPEQLSVTGFDDIEGAALAKPPLTTVRVSTMEMGRLAVRRLVDKIAGRNHDEVLTLVQGDIVQRASCGPPCRL